MSPLPYTGFVGDPLCSSIENIVHSLSQKGVCPRPTKGFIYLISGYEQEISQVSMQDNLDGKNKEKP